MCVVDVCGLEWKGHIQYNNHQQLKTWSTGLWSTRNTYLHCALHYAHVWGLAMYLQVTSSYKMCSQVRLAVRCLQQVELQYQDIDYAHCSTWHAAALHVVPQALKALHTLLQLK